MKSIQLRALTCLALFAASQTSFASHPPRTKFSFGIHIGSPAYRPSCHWRPPHCGPRYYSIYRPAPVYYYTRPRVIVEPAPVIIRQPTVVAPATTATTSAVSPDQDSLSSAPSNSGNDAAIQQHLQQLTNPSEQIRSDAVMALGRARAFQAVDRLNAVLAGDASPLVRDAAARALGLIGSPDALPTLTYAAQSDSDRDVRRSAQFAVDVIRANMNR